MTEITKPLKVVVITEDDPLYVYHFFEVFFDEMGDYPVDICGLTISKAFHEPLWKTARRMLRFYGWFGFLRLMTRFLRTKLVGQSIRGLATSCGVPVIDTSSVNDSHYLEQVRQLAPDVLISVAAPEIFRKPLLEVPRLACLNIHSGKLPRYRGMMPTFWQMRNGESLVTVTIHTMVPQLDAGDIVAEKEFPLRENDTLDRVIRETKQLGALLMLDTLDAIWKGDWSQSPIDMANADYFTFPTTSDTREFTNRGHRLI